MDWVCNKGISHMAILSAELLGEALEYLKCAAEFLWIHDEDKPAAVVISRASYDKCWNLSITNPLTKEEFAAYGGDGMVEVLITALSDVRSKVQEVLGSGPQLVYSANDILNKLGRPN
jgi:hypothetical protein